MHEGKKKQEKTFFIVKGGGKLKNEKGKKGKKPKNRETCWS